MGNVFAELKRRHIYRVAAAYAVVAWLILQVVNNVAPIMEAPAWVARVVLLLLVLGFPVALLIAWALEGQTKHAGDLAAVKTGPVDWLLAAALAMVIGVFTYQQLASTPHIGSVQLTSVAPDVAPTTAISVAVLPFTNVSADRDQEYFSDGMTDEINAALAKVPDLHVVARTSVFEFKGQNRDVRSVGQSLGATHIIEGTVRKDGERLRITAQLVRTGDGLSLWSDTYDRELTDVFAVQEDIARAIAGALRVPLGLRQGETLVRNRTEDLTSYQQYLRARALLRARAVGEAIAFLESVVTRDPNYAPAWAILAYAYGVSPAYDPGIRNGRVARPVATQPVLDKGEAAARKAIELDPKFANGYAALALIQAYRAKWAESEDFYLQALALDPADSDVLHSYRQMLSVVGRQKQSLSVSDQLRTLEPFVPIYNVTTAAIMQLNGKDEETIPLLEAVPNDAAISLLRNARLAKAHAAAGRFRDAADSILAIRGNFLNRAAIETVANLLRSPTKAAAPEKLPSLDRDLSFVYFYVGAGERVFENYEREIMAGFLINPIWLWDPLYAPLRKTERFKKWARSAHLVDYWKARGWPDLCHPTIGDDFECS